MYSSVLLFLKHNTTKFVMEFQCYFGVFVTTKLISYYKAVSSMKLCRTSLNKSEDAEREWAWF